MKDSYLTLKGNCKGLYKDKGSKFYAFAFRLNAEGEVKNYLKELRSEYHDARHHCFAYVTGNDGDNYRVNDDGEPNHSAGDSILRSIRSRELTNILVVVVRYFGGTKLGIRGLINAYFEATESALNIAKIIKVEIVERAILHFNYENTSEVMQLMEKFKIKIVKQDFKDTCKLEGDVALGKKIELESKLEELKAQKKVISFNITSSQ